MSLNQSCEMVSITVASIAQVEENLHHTEHPYCLHSCMHPESNTHEGKELCTNSVCRRRRRP